MTIKPVHIVVLVLVALSVILAYDALTASLNPYVSVSQVAGDSRYRQQEVQILATVNNFSFDDKGTLLVEITDGNATITAYYAGVPPQGLTRGQKIVAVGVLTAPGHLDATQLLVKCPSRYG
jgi:cytochrome c-type biogenesis protein CcmE